MRIISLLFVTLLALVAPSAQAAITLVEAQAEADAWMTPRLAGWATEFAACAASDLSKCHPTWSSTVLPNTPPSASALATVTNDDPGPFVGSVCGDCYDDTRNTWVISGADIPGTSPVQLQTSTFKGPGGVGIQIVARIKYDGVIWAQGYSLFGIAPEFGWREVVP